ncbi:MAG: Mrp/NBP35 family ATP-binding protein [Candidatus Nanopelagicales bacterium]
MPTINPDDVNAALAKVEDPEIHRPITDLGMVKSVEIDGGRVRVAIFLTVSGCPMKDTITQRVTLAVGSVRGVSDVEVELDVMNDEQRKNLKSTLQGGREAKEIVFSQPGNRTHVYAITSGKGGVGKSSVTVNLAVAMAARGQSVGIVDADIYGHSIPGLMGITSAPTVVEGMIMPSEAHGVRAISMLPFKPGGSTQPVAFRGPMLHRALEQFLSDVWWGDLDVLLLDLPPGTGDIAISSAQLLPSASLVVVTTPQSAAADVAVRSGMLAEQTHQKVAGVIENMSGFPCPHCGEPIDLFGVGGGARVAEQLSAGLGSPVPLLGRVPFDPRLREGGDRGEPLVLADPSAPAAASLIDLADQLSNKPRGLVGQALGLTPSR